MEHRLNEQVAESRQEEQRLREVISQLQHQQSSLQSVGNERGATEAVLKQKERELNEVSWTGINILLMKTATGLSMLLCGEDDVVSLI